MQKLQIIAIFIFILNIFHNSYAEKFISDLSDNKIEIDSNFNGSELLIFGTLANNHNLIIIVSSKNEDINIKKRTKKFGLWIGSEKCTIKNMPDFYHLFSTKPINELINNINLEILNIGIDSFNLKKENENIFFNELIKIKNEKNLYLQSDQKITIKDNLLFKSKLNFPANVSLGQYMVQIFVYDDYKLLNIQNIPISVYDKGFNQWIIKIANEKKLIYLIIYAVITMTAAIINNYILKRYQ